MNGQGEDHSKAGTFCYIDYRMCGCVTQEGVFLLQMQKCVDNGWVLAWDDNNKERSALNVSSFKVLEQPLELTNRGEVNSRQTGETARRWGRRGAGFTKVTCARLSVCSCLCVCFCLWHARMEIWIFLSVGLCIWHARVKCVCVGDCSTARVSVTDGEDLALSCPALLCGQVVCFLLLPWIVSRWFLFPFPLLPSVSTIPCVCLSFLAASKGLFVAYLFANHSSSLQTWATAYKCHLAWLRQEEGSNFSLFLRCIQNEDTEDGNS